MQREHEIERLRLRLVRHGAPRLRMLLMVMLTGGAGFLASYVMLRHGVDSILLRYPLALGIAYAVFLVLLWTWLRLRPDDASLDLPDLPNVSGGRSHAPVTSHGGGSDASDLVDGLGAADEFALPLLAIMVVAAIACASLWVIYTAPALFAELLFDAALAAGLYRRLRRSEARHWLETALRKTLLPFALTLLALVAFGLGARHYRPDAHSIGEVFQPVTPQASPTGADASY